MYFSLEFDYYTQRWTLIPTLSLGRIGYYSKDTYMNNWQLHNKMVSRMDINIIKKLSPVNGMLNEFTTLISPVSQR